MDRPARQDGVFRTGRTWRTGRLHWGSGPFASGYGLPCVPRPVKAPLQFGFARAGSIGAGFAQTSAGLPTGQRFGFRPGFASHLQSRPPRMCVVGKSGQARV